jgi:corrinoid protein of di/trimethylamine methyltransferase
MLSLTGKIQGLCRMKTEEVLNKIIEGVIDQSEDLVEKSVMEALEADIDPMVIINDGLTEGLKKVGRLFADEEIFLPELILCGEIVTNVMKNIEEKIKSGNSNINKKGTVLIATVKGDVHDIGKNLVTLLMGASGYNVVDLGKDVSASVILEKIHEINPHIVALSSLLSTTMPAQKDTIQTIEEAGIRDKVKIMVGGAPVTRAWAEEIGADGYAEDASSAVVEADRILGF